ncbi:MAG: ligD [Acidobacteria bacterium]|nr:ligD [Acidobacteriota bacterium]
MPGPLLKKYQSMRDFSGTPEPSGAKAKKKGKALIFVIQKHHASHLHYDFRLEMEGVLKSWAIPKGPSYDPSVKRLAMMTEDHPYDYAGFEGVIPAGNYGGGNVIVWDNGTWELIEPGDDPVQAVQAGKLTFRLYGKKMFGEWALVRIHGHGSSDRGNEWLLLKHRDEFANEKIDITEVAPRSILSDKLVDEVGSERIWQSNRKAAAGGHAGTLAARLEAEEAAKKGSRAIASKPSTPRKRAAGKNTTTKAAGRATKATAKRSGASRSPAAPSPAASSPSRSSRARSPRAAAPTPRRRPR